MKGNRSQQIDNPSVVVTLKIGRPNVCQLDQTMESTAQHFSTWHRPEKSEVSAEQKQISAAAVLSSSGSRAEGMIASSI